MVGRGPRFAIDRAESGNSRPTVVRACALLDRRASTREARQHCVRHSVSDVEDTPHCATRGAQDKERLDG